MQAVILAAGEGTRLLPLTSRLPKCLVEIAGRTILDRQLEALEACGVRRVRIVTGAHADQIEERVRVRPETSCAHNVNFRTSNILESFRIILDEPAGEGDWLVMAGDVIFEPEVMRRLIAASPEHSIALCYGRKRCGEEEVKIRLDEDARVRRLGKALDPADAQGEFLGLFRLSGVLISRVREVAVGILTTQKKAYLFDLLNHLIDEGHRTTGVDVTNCLWEEIDFPEDVERASKRCKAADPAARKTR